MPPRSADRPLDNAACFGQSALVAAPTARAEAAENLKGVLAVVKRRRLLPLVVVLVLPLACGGSEASHRCPFGECTSPASADASVASPSAALVEKLQTTADSPTFISFGLLFRDKLAANSIAVVEALTVCDDAAAVSGVVLDRRDAGDLDVAIDTAMACWATASSPHPLAVVLVTVTLPVGRDEQLLMINTSLANPGEDLQLLPEVTASWAVGYSWRYSTNDNDSG